MRQTEKRNARNKTAKKAIKLQIKKFLTVIKDGTPEQKQTEFKAAVRKLDRAAGDKVIHRNAASRKKSQLAKILAAPAPVPTAKK